MVPADDFYETYHGHEVSHLRPLVASLRSTGCQRIVWLAGDSSLDNKYWLFDQHSGAGWLQDAESCAPALNGYERVLQPPRMVKDVCYWLNKAFSEARPRGGAAGAGAPRACCVNTAVEESTLGQRMGSQGRLHPQDAFLRDNIGENDVLIVDVGGNDIALQPTVTTAVCMALLLCLSCTCMIESLGCAIEVCPGWFFGFPIGFSHFVYMFRNQTKEYIEKLVRKTKPKRVVVCMLYYLDETPTGGWADRVLKLLGYDLNPAKLQAVIRRVFELATSHIEVEGTEVLPCPLFEALDGRCSADYVQRVEPSVQGGQKMAELLAPMALQC